MKIDRRNGERRPFRYRDGHDKAARLLLEFGPKAAAQKSSSAVQVEKLVQSRAKMGRVKYISCRDVYQVFNLFFCHTFVSRDVQFTNGQSFEGGG
jgi:hypothetical protein